MRLRRRAARPVILSLVGAAVIACAGGSGGRPSKGKSLVLRFSIDAPLGGEQYECFGYDASPLAGRWVRAIAWTPAPASGVVLHHASLYALSQDYPAGPVPCDTMPIAWPMHVWAPGGEALALPDDVAVELPKDTRRLVVQAHVLRLAAGGSPEANATIDTTDVAPLHVATWIPALGSVPAIRPHTQEHTATRCTAAAAMHVVSAWPHMHRLGTAFQSTIVHADGRRTVIADVPWWNFDRQRTYLVGRDLLAGEDIETDCTWFNPTDHYVLPGRSTSEEMCGEGLIVWPAQSAAWQHDCQ
jgi:hypothetical protein